MLTIVDYGVGNLNSIFNMLKKAGIKSLVSGKKEDLLQADKILLPGMGHFDNCMSLIRRSGLMPVLEQKVFIEKVPILGICVGLQMFMASSEEGTEPGLGWIKGKSIKFRKGNMPIDHKVPNMGWLDVRNEKESPLLEGLNESRFYFAHSFHVEPEETKDILLTANYGYRFAVALELENIIGVQFHPEKSHRYGMQLLYNFSSNYP